MPQQRFYFQKGEPHTLLKNVCGSQTMELIGA